jgi:hypothetical protein
VRKIISSSEFRHRRRQNLLSAGILEQSAAMRILKTLKKNTRNESMKINKIRQWAYFTGYNFLIWIITAVAGVMAISWELHPYTMLIYIMVRVMLFNNIQYHVY